MTTPPKRGHLTDEEFKALLQKAYADTMVATLGNISSFSWGDFLQRVDIARQRKLTEGVCPT